MEVNKDMNRNNLLKGYNMLLYFTGSMITYEPTEECVADFWKNGLVKSMPVSSTNPRFMTALSQFRDSCLDKTFCARLMREDFKSLFAVGESALAPLIGSYYSDGSSDTNNSHDKVGEFYDSYDWTSRLRGKIPDDHLGVELLFLSQLVEEYIMLDDKACCSEMQNEIIRFIDQHILSWIPQWNHLIQKHADTLCYKSIGTLIYALAEDIRNLMVSKRDSDRSVEVLKN